MTGYASGSAQVGSVSLDLEIKSVNSKNLDLKIYLPEYLSSLENELRQAAAGKVFRGSVVLKIKASQHSELSNEYFLNGKVLNTVFEKIQDIEKICEEKKILLKPLKASDFLAEILARHLEKISPTSLFGTDPINFMCLSTFNNLERFFRFFSSGPSPTIRRSIFL